MNRDFFVNMVKEKLLRAKQLPSLFFIERRGVPLQANSVIIPTTPTLGDGACFSIGRHAALECHWNIEDVVEIAFATIEKSEEGCEQLVIAFCIPALEPVCAERRIGIQRSGGNIALLDSSEEQPVCNDLLFSFAAGIASASLTNQEMIEALTLVVKEIGEE
jgi:hypothetical protein